MLTKYTRSIILFALFQALSLPGCGPGLNFEKFTSSEGGFSVKLPSQPRRTTGVISHRQRDFTLSLFLIDNFQDHSLLIGYTDLPVTWLESQDSQRILQNLQKSAISSMNAMAITENSLDTAPPGREALVMKDGYEYLLRWYLKENRLYQVSIAARKINKQIASLFLNSLKIQDKKSLQTSN